MFTAYRLLLTVYRSPFTAYDFYDFYDFNGFNDLNDLNDLTNRRMNEFLNPSISNLQSTILNLQSPLWHVCCLNPIC
jgi:hypothetical protein